MNSLFSLNFRHKLSASVWIVFAVFLVGAMLRCAYVIQVGSSPFLNLSLPKTDLFLYDILARNLIHPHPFTVNTTVYPFTVKYISLIYQFFGIGHLPVYLMNFVLSMISVGLLVTVGKNLFGWMSGVVAGLGMMFYRMNFFYDGLKEGTALSQFLLIGVVFSFVMLIKKERQFFYVLLLAFVLLACQMRYFYWLVAIPVVIYCIIRFKHWQRPFLIVVNVLFIVGFLCVLDSSRGAEGFQHRFAVHFYLGNHAGGSGMLDVIPEFPLNGEGFAKGSILVAYADTGSNQHIDRYWIRRTFDSYRQEGYGQWLKLIAKKLSYLTNNYEAQNHTSVYYYEKYTFLKYFPRLNFAVIFSLAMAGIFLAFVKRNRAGMFLFLPVIFLTLMMLSIFITARYRMPLIPVLCLYAGFAVEQFVCFVRDRKFKDMVLFSMLVIAMVLWANNPVELFRKDKDVEFWEKELKRMRGYYQNVEKTKEQYSRWDSLNYQRKLALTFQLEKNVMPHEFLEAYDKVFPRAQFNRGYKTLLMRQRAQFEESNFNFQGALEILEQLQQDPEWKSFAQEKIRQIKIVGPLLDKNFK